MKRYKTYRTFHHPGGDGWTSAWLQMWYQVGVFAAEDIEDGRQSLFFHRILESVRPE